MNEPSRGQPLFMASTNAAMLVASPVVASDLKAKSVT